MASRNPKPTPDQAAAHEFLAELRTRIATRPLHYQHGVEQAALESLWKLFDFARHAIKKNPGCTAFADKVIHALDRDIRPVTANWQRSNVEGVLFSRDGADGFRTALNDLRPKLLKLAEELYRMAYGKDLQEAAVDPLMTCALLDELLKPLDFGIVETGLEDMGYSLNPKEEHEVDLRRKSWGLKKKSGEDAVGLALSGGGIRSATFALGAIQVLADKKLLKEVDFLSTVSGGGYTGSFLTSRLGAGEALEAVGSANGPDTPAIRHLRQSAKYLMAGSLWDKWGMVCATAAGTLLNTLIPLVILIGMAVLTTVFKTYQFLSNLPMADKWGGIYAFAISLLLLLALTYFNTRNRIFSSILAGLAGIVIAVMACFLIDRGFDRVFPFPVAAPAWHNMGQLTTAVSNHFHGHGASWASLVGIATGISAAIPIILRFVPVLRNPVVRVVVMKLALMACGVLVPVLAIMTFYVFCAIGNLVTIEPSIFFWVYCLLILFLALAVGLPSCQVIELYKAGLKSEKPFEWSIVTSLLPVVLTSIFLLCLGYQLLVSHPSGLLHMPDGARLLVLAGMVLSIISTFLVNINRTGPHQLYRDGLTQAFVRGRNDKKDSIPLAAINPTHRAPYHLINATANLTSSASAPLKERRCDFFLFSKFFCGSPSLGYSSTDLWKMNDNASDLGTAMAISGAAFSANMGLGSYTPLRSLLALLNIRLGFWMRRPSSGFLNFPKSNHPGFICLLREMFGFGMSEKCRWINLSDGGHIENLGIYELLRRRSKFIIAVDGEADPEFNFHGLMTLARHAQIDFGINMELNLDLIRSDLTTGLSKCHYHLCRIHYPKQGKTPAGTGLLLYLKLSVTGNESELIKRYRVNHPDFPHQTTLDQFFDQEQFEAYRQLGAHVMEGLFSDTLTSGQSSPANVKLWFRCLAENLLVPAEYHPFTR